MRTPVALLGLLLLGSLLAPLTDGSHTVGHRYLVFGRLIDGAGNPVQNQDVSIQIMSGSDSLASIITKTDCIGDFENWDGQPGNDPPGGGQIEQNQNPQYGRYIAFHFHDPDLSDRYDVRLTVGQESFVEDFHSRTRQTSVRHQLSATFPAACGNYTAFNSTFEVRASALNHDEMSYSTEATPKPRRVEATLGGRTINGTTDFNGAYIARFENITASPGDKLQLNVQEVGAKSLTLSEEDLRFRRVDAVYVVGERVDVGGGLRVIGYIAVALVVIIAVYLGVNKARDKMAEKKLRESSTRRRFRRENR